MCRVAHLMPRSTVASLPIVLVLILALALPTRASGPAFMVKDIGQVSRNRSSQPNDIVAIGDTGFFIADDGENGRNLWRSDGTAVGTALVKDIYPGAGSSYISDLTNVSGALFFVADDGSHGVSGG
jgi:ELWxxDGT repeat protein